ncbi:MAG: N-acetyl-alpha-D-glucosaminyl L-malate synthase BshA [Candidatus Syntrophonatronum acetioxidans]|uniref:N-acetyl-alpha-D-glucosaminyl L-malate synthase BshA n=1 Tax=Candidatus Syntrophonatronum acetioxidans TaxID=1795816 RepID=A0A424YGQ0_9FIRM|nr:MAG: N-acetyl-alpha-D-glucosaminyl L-malate synthase BshA [Candidatus Syntrophonatronum acetioxidans]
MKVGILCYPTHGGSGVVATEMGKCLANWGHQVHFISYQQPFRLQGYHPGIFYHEVEVPNYPLFDFQPYDLALVNKVVSVVRERDLDIIHAHYAVPHSACAYLARQVVGRDKLKIITTLHGTDITLVGSNPSFREITTFSLRESDAVTAVSKSLQQETLEFFPGCPEPVFVPNFIDTKKYSPHRGSGLPCSFSGEGEKILLHISNFRPVKRVLDVVRVFYRVQEQLPCRLLMVGDGIDRYRASQLVEELGLKEKVSFLGVQDDVLPMLNEADLFLLTSEKESFGLAILEAMACGLPVVASNAGGIPEVVEEGKTGFLYQVGDVEAMAEGCLELLTRPELYKAFCSRSRERAVEDFHQEKIVKLYEEIYLSLVKQS